MNVLEVKNLTKKYGKFTAVDNLSFELKKGEILGLLGPNGAGKTTSLQMLLGVLTPTGGQIKYFGKNFGAHREEILNKINFSSTYVTLPPYLSVKENLTFISYLYSIENRKKRVQEVLDIFDLSDLKSQLVDSLSAGQATRLNLAKAFLNLPEVLLLDEPTASLDPEVAAYIRRFILEHRKQTNMSIIFTSHNMSEVEEVCDRVLFIDHGKIIADDAPEKLARTLNIAHLELIPDDQAELEKFCKEQGLKYRIEGKVVFVDVLEKRIAEVLQKINKAGITYSEISIEKPDLEDFFLTQVQRGRQ